MYSVYNIGNKWDVSDSCLTDNDWKYFIENTSSNENVLFLLS